MSGKLEYEKTVMMVPQPEKYSAAAYSVLQSRKKSSLCPQPTSSAAVTKFPHGQTKQPAESTMHLRLVPEPLPLPATTQRTHLSARVPTASGVVMKVVAAGATRKCSSDDGAHA
jgi:hypothetical protein